MDGSLRFARYLCLMVGLVFGLYLAGAWYAHTKMADIAPQFTANGPLNQKVLFLKQIWPKKGPVTAVIGASMALNNFDSDRFAARTGASVVDLGANGITLSEADTLYRQVVRKFDVKDVILVAQFNELRDNDRDIYRLPDTTFSKYMDGHLNWIEEFSFRDLTNSFDMIKHRKALLKGRTDYMSSDFTPTGFVPLQIYGPQIDQRRWNANELSNPPACLHCTAVLESICRDVRASGKSFTLIAPPVTPYIQGKRPDVAQQYQAGRERMGAAMRRCGGTYFDAGAYGQFADDCFADFMHLNAPGARALTDAYVNWKQSPIPAPPQSIHCSVTSASQLEDRMAQEAVTSRPSEPPAKGLRRS